MTSERSPVILVPPVCLPIGPTIVPSSSSPELCPLEVAYSRCLGQRWRRWTSTSARPSQRVASPMHWLPSHQRHHHQEPIPPFTDDNGVGTPARSNHIHQIGPTELLSSCTHLRRGRMKDGVQHSHMSPGVPRDALWINECSYCLPGTCQWCAQRHDQSVCFCLSGRHTHLL